jgi:hypothetical protein
VRGSSRRSTACALARTVIRDRRDCRARSRLIPKRPTPDRETAAE